MKTFQQLSEAEQLKWAIAFRNETQEFYAGLGEFILAFADIERFLRQILIHYSRVDEELMPILFAGSGSRARHLYERNPGCLPLSEMSPKSVKTI